MIHIHIDPDKCKKDGSCALVCPEAIFIQSQKATQPQIAPHVDECISCGQCVSICPQGAIQHSDFPEGSILHPLDLTLLPSEAQIMALLRTRRSMRALWDKPVEKELLEKIIEGARLAPSARNRQGTQYIVVQNPVLLHQITALTIQRQKQIVQTEPDPFPSFSRLVRAFEEKGDDQILRGAPVLLVFYANSHSEFAEASTNLALENAALVCQGVGLACFYAGYVVDVCQNDDAIPRLLSIPADHVIYGALAIGYPKLKFKNRPERKPASVTWL
jgi:nitroreductase/NAD-dependent dihydropyrimidine dehydrogenase PreA subunit